MCIPAICGYHPAEPKMSLWRRGASALETLVQILPFYRKDDADKDQIIKNLTAENIHLKRQLRNRSMDLIDQISSRRQWQKRALEAERSLTRNPFVVLLIDGDGYIFENRFVSDREAGAIKAAQELYAFFRDSVREVHTNDEGFSLDFEVAIRIYVNKTGLATAMVEAGIIDNPEQMNSFFVRLTQSHPLIDVVDCGGGKERADEKIREQYRHYTSIANCKHVSVACCHDSGYVPFLEKFQKCDDGKEKTSLFATGVNVHASFSTLEFKRIICEDIFRKTPNFTKTQRHSATYAQIIGSKPALPSPRSPNGCSPVSSPGTGISRCPSSRSPIRVQSLSTPTVPVNRYGQRVDISLDMPSEVCFNRLKKRTKNGQLCAEFHLNGKCSQGKGCQLDHNQLKAGVKEALQYSLRATACKRGLGCRKADCYYGHHCPAPGCGARPSCEFEGMHGIDQTIAKHVPAVSS
ncbi:hypothetical protein DTO207G8_4698 [Paecilomyces variotii]|nr:hypothetical protein DTO169E5_7958 [Paecilomyces variotii]KAJ9252636.1 hypothetical protein DTO207G8_4698 [Paecilomyces variotii]